MGLHPQLVAYDPTKSDGANVGLNPVQTVSLGSQRTYTWYAGHLERNSNNLVATPVEPGAVNLISSDPIKHSNKGAIGALIIEPKGSRWTEDASSRASATVYQADGTNFREFVMILQNDLNLRYDAGAVPNLADSEDLEDSGQKAVNYRTEPMWKRVGFEPNATLEFTRTQDFTNALSNSQVGGDPVTPVFVALRGKPVRFRLLHPGGHQRNNVFQVHGHVWEEEPFITPIGSTVGSTQIGSNPLSEWMGSYAGIGPSSHFNFVLKNGAGGKYGAWGDFLVRDMQSFQFDGGIWGILRVTPFITP